MILAGGVDSAPPRGSQGMKGPWAIGLMILPISNCARLNCVVRL